ncbi:MAG: nucleotide-binding enzyme [Polyangiaceae bacterium]
MSVERHGGIRVVLAREAARLMLEEGVKQYFVAKRMAARRVLNRAEAESVRFRPRDLPSNGEIRAEILALARRAEGSRQTRRLFAMRVTALEAMRALEGFEPRLIGSVSTGHVRRGSDIDLSLFTLDEDAVEARIRATGWVFERERVSIQKHGKIAEYVHYHVALAYPLELTLYDPMDLRVRVRSSTDGKPIVRMRASDVRALLEAEHSEAWARYLEDGLVPCFPNDEEVVMPALGFDGWLEDEG